MAFGRYSEKCKFEVMKVLVINGSPHINGCTDRALREVEGVLKENDIACVRVNVGNKDIRGCIACYTCRKTGKCIFNDLVNETAPLFAECDGVLIGSPTYYAGSNGQLHAFLDRLFFSTGGTFDKTMKVGAAVVSSRRAGSTSVFDEINKYFTITSMPIASSTYWNEVHGFTAEDVERDKEGLQTMHNLGRNMAFLIKAIAAAKENEGIPAQERTYVTNFLGD